MSAWIGQRARVNERMDWVNTQLSRDLVYGVVYPQILPAHKRRSDEAQDATLQWGKERAQGWLTVLNDHYLGSSNAFVCGNAMTIADLLCAEYVFLGEVIGSDFAAYPNLKQWLGRMKALKSWAPAHQVIEGYAASLDKSKFVVV